MNPANVFAAPLAKPSWMRYFDPSLSVNTDPIQNSKLDGLAGWNIWINASGSRVPWTSYRIDPSQGSTAVGGSGPGSLRIDAWLNDTTVSAKPVYVHIEQSFDWDMGPPAGIDASVSLASEISGPIAFEVSVYLTIPNGTRVNFLIGGESSERITVTSSWKAHTVSTPKYKPRTAVTEIPVPISNIVKERGTYILQIIVKVCDERARPVPAHGVLFIDDVRFFFYGSAYGVLGSDNIGRDLFAQLLWGSRVSLLVGFTATFIALAIGTIVGLVAGYFGGAVDEVLMRIVDVMMVLPGLPFMIALAAILGASIWNLVIVIAIVGWAGTARLIRSQVLSVKERQYIEAARASGAGSVYLMFRHILPNVLPLVFVVASTGIGGVIIAEASLSFLGLGDPHLASWGQMLYNAEQAGAASPLVMAWWWIIPPGVCIAALALAFILLGTALDEILNPRLRRRM